jgi:hypothetical protein
MNFLSLLTVSVIPLFILSGCDIPPLPPPDQPAAMWESIQLDTVTGNVEEYMRLTLENVPGLKDEYAKAKTMLTPNFAAEFTAPVFVPTSYCIQNNPDDVKVVSVSFNNMWNQAEVVVHAKYGDDPWRNMWLFTVVISDGEEWLIDSIECTYLLDEDYQNLINNI